MTHTTYDVLLNALGTASRSEALGGTMAADVRGFLIALLKQALADADAAAPAFAPIAPQQYGSHPAFSSQAALNAWLLSRVGSGCPGGDSSGTTGPARRGTTHYAGYGDTGSACYGTAGYLGINAALLASAPAGHQVAGWQV